MKKKVKKKVFFLIYIIILSIILVTNHGIVSELADMIFKTTQEQKPEHTIEYGKSEIVPSGIEVIFCPSQNCFNILNSSFSNAKKSIHCALFELDEEELSNTLVKEQKQGIDVKLVIDGDYYNEDGLMPIKNSNISLVTDGARKKFMHNKFCVIDNKSVITGSMNPTQNGIYYNNNNILKIDSSYLARNYQNEFEQLKSKKFGPSKISTLQYNSIILLHNKTSSYHISSYFCPQDNCAKETLNVLNSAKKEILFANFVLTLDEIEELLLLKEKEGLNIQGVIESRSVNLRGSRITDLMRNISIVRDSNPKTMHHKVFVVDEEYVITGSMNPTASGTRYNDENLLIIKNRGLALKYKEEILKLIKNGK